MTTAAGLRHATRCQSCQTPLVVICLAETGDAPVIRVVTFRCSSCGAWNTDNTLPGCGVQSVILDPRKTTRA